MTAKTGGPSQGLTKLDDHLHLIDERLRTNGVNAMQRSEMLAELKSHLIDRIAEFEAEGSPDPFGRAVEALGDPIEIVADFTAIANLRAASPSFFPVRLLTAAWTMTSKFGQGLRLFAFGLAGYALSVGTVFAAVMKLLLPEKVGFWVGENGVVWGIPPDGALAHELIGAWFIPISAWLAIFFAVGTTLLLRHQIQSFMVTIGLRRSVSFR
jgi:hypothetical protein